MSEKANADPPEDMPEPALAATQAAKPLFPPPQPDPVGASPLLAFLLRPIQDPTIRRQLEEAAWGLSDGQEDHMLTQAAALFSGIQQAHLARSVVLYDEHHNLLIHLGGLLKELGRLGDSIAAGANKLHRAKVSETSRANAPAYDLAALTKAFRSEADAAIQDAYRAGFRTALGVGVGCVVLGLVIAFCFHHP